MARSFLSDNPNYTGPSEGGGGDGGDGGDGGGAETTPTLTLLNPNTAVVGGVDLTMHVRGTGFTESSVIYFNNGAEATTFVSDTELTTVVKPSTASGAGEVPVVVKNGELASSERMFEFTAA